MVVLKVSWCGIRSVNVRDPNFELERKLGHSGVQAVPELVTGETQTPWFRKQNVTIQYEPQLISSEEQETALQSEGMTEFLRRTREQYELSLQQNEVVNNYEDGYKNGDDEGEAFGQSTDDSIQEAFSFVDRDQTVQCVQFHPDQSGMVAMAACERGGFDERVETAGKIQRSKILIYDYTEAIAMEPVIILEACLDEGISSFYPPILVYMENPCRNNK